MTVLVSEHIPQGVIERLPAYLSALLQLRHDGSSTASSAQLSELTDVNAAQIRRDLAYFGSFGKRGVGYDVGVLIERIQRILGSDHSHRIALVGAGNLGSAIAAYDGFSARGFQIAAMFDNDPAKVGSRVGDLVVRDMTEMGPLAKQQDIRFGVVAVPSEAAQDVVDAMVAAGIQVILNYSPTHVNVPDDCRVHNTDPVRELLHTLYYLSRAEAVSGA